MTGGTPAAGHLTLDTAASLLAGHSHLVDPPSADSLARAVELNAVAHIDAAQLDPDLIAAARRAGSPLAGRAVGIKDMIDVAGAPSRYGSEWGRDTPKVADAPVVQALRRAGAVPAVKTQTHEYAYGPTGDVTAAGPVRNPHDPSLMSGGSSAGSAAAIGCGALDLALGTDTGGSGRTPAAFCGIYGLRPTYAATSIERIFPLSPSLDTVSPMAGSIQGIADLWAALSGQAPSPQPGYRPLSIGFLAGAPWSQTVDSVSDALQDVSAALAALGHSVTRYEPSWTELTHRLYPTIQGPEAAALHADNLAQDAGRYQPEVLARLRGAQEVPGWEYCRALGQMEALRSDVPGAFGGHDLLLCATSPVTAPRIGQREAFGAGWDTVWDVALAFTVPFSVLGVPALSVPVWKDTERMPVGIQLAGRPGSEWQLIGLAQQLGDMRKGKG
ncbi:amidase [Arthrobacter sp. zg-Y1110]|uniref:amidase n=1 Tax=Arthrobacter sp. zg-Y1110 TaxID=2886932 RepID=UPI001D150422|nr:amidase [Arthrobacter sp. zg-Y1110]MCC3291785.1 amidase [Arthrobacter sp. zg-Y1110]UWX85617.1 amidase [Arthrobacter sp. zg-Y1110]